MSVSQPVAYRLAAVTSHPVQYQAPLFQYLAQQSAIDLTVYYGHAASVSGMFDPGFGISMAWDRPLLDGYRWQTLHQTPQPDTLNALLKNIRLLVAAFRQEHYHAVLINGYAAPWPLTLAGYVAAWLTRTPILLRCEAEVFKVRSRKAALARSALVRMVFAATAAYLTIGTANREFYLHYGVPDKKLFLTPYSVDNDYFNAQYEGLCPRQADLKSSLGYAPDLPIIVFSGKLIDRKRPLDLAQAYQQLIASGLDAGLIFIGDGELRPALQAYIDQHGLTKAKILGFQNQAEISQNYACGDIFVLPAAYDTWGLVVNEGMIFGMPAISTNMVGAHRDLIQPGVTGYVYPVGDVVALSEKLRLLIQNPEQRQQMGQAARQRVLGLNYQVCTNGILEALATLPKPTVNLSSHSNEQKNS